MSRFFGCGVVIGLLFSISEIFTVSVNAATLSYPGSYSGYRIFGANNISIAYSFTRDNKCGIQHYFLNDFNDDMISGCYPIILIDNKYPESLYTAKNVINTPYSFYLNSNYPSDSVGGLSFNYNIYSTIDGIFVYDITINNTSKESHSILILPYFSSSLSTSSSLDNGIIDYNYSEIGKNVYLYCIDEAKLLSFTNLSGKYQTETLSIPPGESTEIYFAVASGTSSYSSNYIDVSFQQAKNKWNAWFSSSIYGNIKFSDKNIEAAFFAALLGVIGTEINGMIPAGVTGQFVTYGLPQLYPRDALMCTRAIINAGYADIAKSVMSYWQNPSLAFYKGGAWYARYDSKGEAVNSGSGAPYDVPEYDSNAYFTIDLVDYYLGTGIWQSGTFSKESDIYKLILKLNNFIVNQIDSDGLVSDGGIVEIGGSFLPSTNMTLVPGLRDAALLAYIVSDTTNASLYYSSSNRISAAISLELYDSIKNSYIDIRSDGSKYYNVSTLFGFLYGYNDDMDKLVSTYNSYLLNNQPVSGGFQYFGSQVEPYDPNHPSGTYCYGNSIFGFTTGAAAEFSAITGLNQDVYEDVISWMMKNSNIYGQLPEHIWFPNYNLVSDESPLTWSDAEFVNAVIIGAETGNSLITSDYQFGLKKIVNKYNNFIKLNNLLAANEQYGIPKQSQFVVTGNIQIDIFSLNDAITLLYNQYISEASESPSSNKGIISDLLAKRLLRIKQLITQLKANSSSQENNKSSSKIKDKKVS